MKIGLKASLRVIISCFIVVPAAFSLIVGLKSLSRFSEMSVGQQMAELGSLKTAGIEQEINSYISELSAAASLEFITKAGSGLYADAKDETDSYIENTIKNYPFILDVAITDISGCVMADHIERKLGAFFPGHVAELNTLGKNEVYISKIFLKNSDFGDKDIFYMTKPLVRDDATVGFISFSVSSEAFSQAIESGRFLNNGELWIVDGNGAILGRLPNEATEYRDVTDTGLKNFIQNSLKPEFKNADIPYDTFDTGNRIGVYGIFSGFDWYWLSTYPSANLNQFYISYFIPLVLIEVGLVLVCFVVMFYISNMFISPLYEIISGMKSINNGDMNIRLQIKGKVEYDRITDAFNTLLDNALISEELYRTISNISGNTLFEWDSQKGAMFTSNDFNHIFNVNLKSATLSNGNFIDSLMGPTEAERYRQDISKLIKTGSELFGEYLITTKQNKHLWFSVRAKCITNRVGELQRVIGFITNIDNEKKLNLQLSERASYDFLTKLYNRNTFLRLLKTELERTAMPKIAVLFVDIDDFKNINDKYGHGTGDEIIKYVSSAVKAELKNNGFAGRFGGDEFVMCVTNPYMVDRVEELASDLLGIYNEGFFSELINTKLKIKISIGIAKSPEHGKTTDSIIAAADEAMYFVKKHGKSNYHVYDPIDINLSNMM